MINGVFHQDYAEDSKITYNWTEHVDNELKKTLADTIIFPEPIMIYLADDYANIQDFYLLHVEFKGQGEFLYKVPVLKYLEKEIKELSRMNMVILIPFKLLKLRKSFKKERSEENIEALKKLIKTDIIKGITENESLGNITKDDARCLRHLTLQLYQHIYERYEELEENGVSDMVEEALVLDIDVINYEHKIAMEELAREKDEALEQKEKVLMQRENEIKAMRMLMKHLPQQEIMRETGLTQEALQALL